MADVAQVAVAWLERHMSVPARAKPFIGGFVVFAILVALVLKGVPLFVTYPGVPWRWLLALLCAVGVYWVYGAVEKAEAAKAALPLNIVGLTGLQIGPWGTAKDVKTGEVLQGSRVILSTMQITNRSSDPMQLVFRAQFNLVRPDGGKTLWPVGGVVRGLDEAGRPEPVHYPGPLKMDGKSTQTYSLMFEMMPGVERYMGPLNFDPKGGHLLVVEDLISGKIAQYEPAYLRWPTGCPGEMTLAERRTTSGRWKKSAP